MHAFPQAIRQAVKQSSMMVSATACLCDAWASRRARRLQPAGSRPRVAIPRGFRAEFMAEPVEGVENVD